MNEEENKVLENLKKARDEANTILRAEGLDPNEITENKNVIKEKKKEVEKNVTIRSK